MQAKNVGTYLPAEEEQHTRKLQYPQFLPYVEAFRLDYNIKERI
jgi:hypothetical protein